MGLPFTIQGFYASDTMLLTLCANIDSRNELTIDHAPLLDRPVVMVPHAWVDEGLTKEATAVLPSLTAFDPRAWGLPDY